MHHTAHALFEYAARGRVLFQKRRNLRFQFQKLNIQVRVNVPCVAGGIVWVRDKSFSPLVTAPPSNLTRLYYNGSAAKSHSTLLQRLRRQISVDYYTIPPATQASLNEA